MPPAATELKSGPASPPGACYVSEVWNTVRWTYSPSLVTLGLSKLKILHFICKWDGIWTNRWTDGRTIQFLVALTDITDQGHINVTSTASPWNNPVKQASEIVWIPCSGKFLQGSYFHDFADCMWSCENKNRNNLFQQKFILSNLISIYLVFKCIKFICY